jgi:hypothetical protein
MGFVKAMLRHTRSQTLNDWVLRLALVILNSHRRMCRSRKRCILSLFGLIGEVNETAKID